MYNKFTFIVVFMFIMPLNIPVIQLGGKPVDVVLSDFVLLFVMLSVLLLLLFKNDFVIKKSTSYFLLLLLAYMLYGLINSFLYSMSSGGDILPTVSAIKFYKPMLFVFVGIYLANNVNFVRCFGTNITKSIFILSLCLMASTLLDSRFPVLLWGERLFGVAIYGFPNSSMSLFAFLSLFVLAKYLHNNSLLYLFSYALLSLNVIFSLSRSSMVVLVVGSIILMSFYLNKIKVLFYLSVVLILSLFVISILKDYPNITPAFELVEDRVERTLGNTENEASSGRFGLWSETMVVVSSAPLFGHSFKPFSSFSLGFDTPHQQYLEVIYKTGIVGFLMYLTIMIYMLVYSYRLHRKVHYDDDLYLTVVVFISGMISLLIGNLTQSNFSYSVTGNLMFFIFGILLAVGGRDDASRLIGKKSTLESNNRSLA